MGDIETPLQGSRWPLYNRVVYGTGRHWEVGAGVGGSGDCTPGGDEMCARGGKGDKDVYGGAGSKGTASASDHSSDKYSCGTGVVGRVREDEPGKGSSSLAPLRTTLLWRTR